MIANPAAVHSEKGKEDRPLTSNDMEKVLEMQNSVMLRRRMGSTFGYPDFGYRPGLNMYQESHEAQNAETIYEQQKLLQSLLKHYQTKLMDESSQWMHVGGLLYPKSQDEVKDEDSRRMDETRKRFKREEDGKAFTKQRKTNFTAKEVETLLNCVANMKEVILFGVAGGKGWAKAWQDIAKIVSKAEGIERTEGDVRKKWTYLKWEAKNTSKPGRDPVSKHVLNILTARDREVDAAMSLRSSSETFPKEVKPGAPLPVQLQSPGSSPANLPKSPLPVPAPSTKKSQPPPIQPVQRPLAPKEQKPSPKPAKPQPPAEVCLRWNSYHSNMQNTFPSLLNNEQFVDVTLACDGRSIKCHKVMLSACSPYLEELLSSNPCQHPIIFLKDMKFWQLAALVDFMYRGEVNVTQDKLPSLLSAAEALQIKGLASPVSAPSPSQTMQDQPENVGLLSQFKSEITTDVDYEDDEYLQDTDDSMPPTSTPALKKRKMSDVSSGGSSAIQTYSKKPKESKEKVQTGHNAMPTHYAPPPSAHAHRDSDDSSLPPDTTYHKYSPDVRRSIKTEDISIDDEQAQMILEQYDSQGRNFSKEEEEGEESNGSG